MKTVLILSRGRRLSATFGRLAKELGKEHRIIVVFRVWKEHTAHDPADWAYVDNLISYHLRQETKVRAKGDLRLRAAGIEKQIGLSAYQSASNYLLYRRFAKDYFGNWTGLYDTEQEILEEFVASYSLISEIFELHRPDLVFCETPDLVSHRVTQTIALQHGVFTLGLAFNNLFGDGLASFTFGCNYRSPVLEYFYRNSGDISQAALRKADELMAKLADGQVHDAGYIREYKKNIGGRIVGAGLLKRIVGRTLAVVKIGELYLIAKRAISVLRNRRWLNRHLKQSIPDGSYILVSLHYQPEASTCLAAPRWIDQDKIIEQLAINAPCGIRIAVKENPRKFGMRGRKYYSRLRDMTNVDLVHPLVDNGALIGNASAILSITGTVGMEGIALGKKVAILGRPSYDIYEGSRKIDYPEEIFAHLADQSWNPAAMIEQRRSFLAAMAEATFIFGRPQNGNPWPRPEDAGPNLARAINGFLALLDRTAFRPDQLCPTL
jgi:Capsule polysaccharide biosynthesis protein